VEGPAVAEQSAVGDQDTPGVERQRAARLLDRRIGARHLGQAVAGDRPGVEAQPDQVVGRPAPLLHERQDPDRPRRQVDHRRGRYPGRVDVTAQERAARHRAAQVGGPHRPAGGGVERIDRVPLGDDDHLAVGHQRLGQDGAVELGGPRPGQTAGGRRPGVDAGALRIVGVGQPVVGA
jgi:hypothetical protein